MFKKVFAMFFAIMFMFSMSVSAAEVGDTVSVGGMAFGIKFYTEGVVILNVSDVDGANGNISPGNEAGLCKGDIILSIDGNKTTEAIQVTDLIRQSNGDPIIMDIKRGDKTLKIEITPVKSKSEDVYMLGLWIKDGTQGIGTVTYIEDNGSFAGLGHGVCDVESGELFSMRCGKVCDVIINGINAGTKGAPGQLLGFFSDKDTGVLTANTVHGVYGVLNSLPKCDTKAVIAAKEEVQEGDAYILCTLDDNIISNFDIKIEKINHSDSDTKNFIIKVTDDTLIQKTGGIVQGMSGSPIIQNGKLIGAVTHVLVDDPTRGYGIFIENMV